MRQAMATIGSGEGGSRSVGSTSRASSYPRYRNQPPANGQGAGAAGARVGRHQSLRRSQNRSPLPGPSRCEPGIEQ